MSTCLKKEYIEGTATCLVTSCQKRQTERQRKEKKQALKDEKKMGGTDSSQSQPPTYE